MLSDSYINCLARTDGSASYAGKKHPTLLTKAIPITAAIKKRRMILNFHLVEAVERPVSNRTEVVDGIIGKRSPEGLI